MPVLHPHPSTLSRAAFVEAYGGIYEHSPWVAEAVHDAGLDNADAPVALDHIRGQIKARDLQLTNPFAKDAQITAIRGARNYRGDKLIRTAKPHAILDPENGPLIAVRLNILTRKSLGGLHTDMQGRVLTPAGDVLEGLFAAGEVCGFGGGGYHGYNALEGTFLGGCIFSGRSAGRKAG